MGYNTKPEMLEMAANRALLDSILRAADEGRSLPLSVKEGANISTEQYRLRRLLSACDAHRTAVGGRFAGLGQRVSLRTFPERGVIEVRPIAAISVERFRPSEKDAIDFLIEQRGTMALVEFWPSPTFSLEKFSSDALKSGWRVVGETKEESEDGKLSFAAEKVESEVSSSKVGFGALA
jgi:hypothetical protein